MGLGVAWWVRQHDGSVAPLGLVRGGTTLRDVGAGVAAGIGALAASAVAIGISMQALGRTEVPNPLEVFGEAWVVPNAVLALILAPVCEEILFRGFWFGGLRQRLRFGWSAVISGALFGMIHGDAVRFAGLAITGVILAAVYERRRTLGASIAAHATVNVLALVGLLANL
jgi:membrane protease YdiL (CAAX protease family)